MVTRPVQSNVPRVSNRQRQIDSRPDEHAGIHIQRKILPSTLWKEVMTCLPLTVNDASGIPELPRNQVAIPEPVQVVEVTWTRNIRTSWRTMDNEQSHRNILSRQHFQRSLDPRVVRKRVTNV